MRSSAFTSRSYAVLANLSVGYPPRQGRFRCIPHPSATRRQPLRVALPFELHVLGMPPAFSLSQDQTIQLRHSRTLAGPISLRATPTKERSYELLSFLERLLLLGRSSSTRRPHKSPAHAVKDQFPSYDTGRRFVTGRAVPEGAAHYRGLSRSVNTGMLNEDERGKRPRVGGARILSTSPAQGKPFVRTLEWTRAAGLLPDRAHP